MAGFNNTPSASEFHKHSSWGRTRSPKNILSQHRAGTNAAGAALAVPTDDPTAVTDGYATENQRFLHVNVLETTTTDTADFSIWVYSHACPRWYKLYVNDGSGGLQPATEQIAAGGKGHFIFEISGIDRVYIEESAGSGALNAFLACSTF